MLKFFVCFAGTILQWNLPWLELELLSQHRMWHSGLPGTFTLSREIATSCLKVRKISTTAFLEKSCCVCLYLMNLSNCCTQAWSVMSEKNLQYKSFRTNTSEKGTMREIIGPSNLSKGTNYPKNMKDKKNIMLDMNDMVCSILLRPLSFRNNSLWLINLSQKHMCMTK